MLHEVTTFRRDVATDGRHAVVAYGVSLEEDLARRDFTINAIAYHPLRSEWRDPFGGAEDLGRRRGPRRGRPGRRGSGRTTSGSSAALRFAARFGFAIDPATWEAAVRRGRRAARSSRPSGCGTSGSRGSRPARSLRASGRALARGRARRRSGSRSSGRSYSRLAERRRPARRDPVVLTARCCRRSRGGAGPAPRVEREIARAAALDAGPPAPAGTTTP